MTRVKIYTTDFCPYCQKAKRILENKDIEYEEVNIHGSERLRDEIEELTGRRDVPQIFIDGEHIGDDDALEELYASGELDNMFGNESEAVDDIIEERELIIIGSGVAGFSTAIYSARTGLKPLIVTGNRIEGQSSLTSKITDYPGFKGENMAELIETIQNQAEELGIQKEHESVREVNFSCYPFWLKTYSKEYSAKSVVISIGTLPRKLNVPGEAEYNGKGVSYCATCDGLFFQNRTVVVVGGSNTAVEAALFLTDFASKISLIYRNDQLHANKELQEQASNNDKVDFISNSIVEEIQGDGNTVNSVLLKNINTEKQTVYPTEGVFVFIGNVPNTKIFRGQLELDEQGYIVTDKYQHTSVEGVFAAGDVQEPVLQKPIISAGTGVAAAMEAEKFINQKASQK